MSSLPGRHGRRTNFMHFLGYNQNTNETNIWHHSQLRWGHDSHLQARLLLARFHVWPCVCHVTCIGHFWAEPGGWDNLVTIWESTHLVPFELSKVDHHAPLLLEKASACFRPPWQQALIGRFKGYLHWSLCVLSGIWRRLSPQLCSAQSIGHWQFNLKGIKIWFTIQICSTSGSYVRSCGNQIKLNSVTEEETICS